MITLSIIIVSYNTRDLLRQCLRSLPWQSNYEVIVVDNASKDDSSKMVIQDFPDARFIQMQHNTGFAKANNAGIKVSRGTYVMLLNSDTEVNAQGLEILIDFLDSTPAAGAVTPKVMLPDGSLDLACHRGMPTPWNAITYFAKLEQLLPSVSLFSGYHQTYKDFDKVHPIDATAATALIVKKSVIDEVGDLDERFFLYGEDLDWCKRITDAGYGIYYHPGATILHHKSASGKKNTSRAARKEAVGHFYDTMKQFYEKHYTKTYPGWLRHLVYLGIDLKKHLHK
jgi:GT2 family glycosyltransferase